LTEVVLMLISPFCRRWGDVLRISALRCGRGCWASAAARAPSAI
jgi:hypothetical protein